MISNWHKSGLRPYNCTLNAGRKNQKLKGDVVEFERLVRSGVSMNEAVKITGVSTYQCKKLSLKLSQEKSI